MHNTTAAIQPLTQDERWRCGECQQQQQTGAAVPNHGGCSLRGAETLLD
jgi:hypothetical protein